jgi:hypothetical protein
VEPHKRIGSKLRKQLDDFFSNMGGLPPESKICIRSSLLNYSIKNEQTTYLSILLMK